MVHRKHKVIDLNFLSKTSMDMSNAEDFQGVSDIIFTYIESLVTFSMIVIYEVDKKNNELQVIASKGSKSKNFRDRVPFKIGEGAVGWVAENKKALLISDALSSNRFQVRQFFNEDPIIRSFLAVPLIVGNDLVGIMSMSSDQPNLYRQQDVELISIIATQAAAILQLNIEVKEARNFSNHILENINSGVIAIDNEYRIIVFNKAAEIITGYTSKEVLGRNVLSLPLKDNKQDWYIVESYDKGVFFFENLGYLIHKSGSKVNIRLSTSVLTNDDNSKKGCICIFRDNTEIEKLQQKILQTEKMAVVGRITAGIAHEIRNPLLPIRTASQLMIKKLDQPESKEQIRDLLMIISEESERLNKFLDEFIDIGKANRKIEGKSDILKTLIETLSLIRPDCEKKNITLNSQLSKHHTHVALPKDQLKQIFLNLLINAIDAIESSQKSDRIINLNYVRNSKNVIIEIIDTGIGIHDTDVSSIFDPFFTTKDRGTGFGLASVQNILSKAGGDITVTSSYGTGSKFIVTLPILKGDVK
ncbi:MAG: ATP-binding protein [Eubacteriales bacterium]|nr:ATP-binding protein [Eubacteriales bacterium]